jgi:hypothetical protein
VACGFSALELSNGLLSAPGGLSQVLAALREDLLGPPLGGIETVDEPAGLELVEFDPRELAQGVRAFFPEPLRVGGGRAQGRIELAFFRMQPRQGAFD